MNNLILLMVIEISSGAILIIFLVCVLSIVNLNTAIIIVITAALAYVFGCFNGIRREKIRRTHYGDEKEGE